MPKIIGTKPRRQESVDPEKIIVETTETKPEEATAEEKPAELTIESIEEFFIDQGNLIEGQLKAENAYPGCPVCSRGKEALTALGRMLESSLKDLDERRQLSQGATFTSDPETDKLVLLNILKRDMEWYDAARTMLGNMFQAGHATRDVMSSHPDLVVSKAQKRKIRSGKHKKQIAKESRRKNRS